MINVDFLLKIKNIQTFKYFNFIINSTYLYQF